MSSLTHIEKRTFEDMLGMSSGYVLDFSDRTFSSFFYDVLKINIDIDKYKSYGTSKANRLRYFWDNEGDISTAKVLGQLVEVWVRVKSINTSENKDYKFAIKAINCLLGKVEIAEVTESDFLDKNFENISIKKLNLELNLIPVIEQRFQEIKNCFKTNPPSSLASIILAGSILEGILLASALNQPAKFNQASSSPKDSSGKVKQFQSWTLNALIEVAYEIGLIKIDVKKFSHALRDFRNYVHPYEQMASGFNPDEHTAKISLQVLKAAIADLSGDRVV